MRLLGKLFGAALLVALVAFIVAANFRQDSAFFQFKWRIQHEPPLMVRFAEAGPAVISRTVEAPGKVEADVEVKISSQVMGRIVDLPVKEGDRIQKGNLIVQLDQAQYQADVRSAESRIERLRASIELADAELSKSRRDLERSQRQFSVRATTTTELADTQTTVMKDQARLAMARNELIEAEGTLSKMREDLQRTTIRAPLNGIVSQLLAKEGEVVVVGTMNNAGTVILSISDPETMVVRARIDENSVPLVKEGQKAMVHFQNNARVVVPGEVKRISPKGSRGSGTSANTTSNDNEAAVFETIIALKSPPPEVRLGMTASVEILVEERSAGLSIPSQAVLHRRAKDLPRSLVEQAEQLASRGPGVKDPTRRYHQVVFVNEGGKARPRLVATGISDEYRVEILDGLKPGEQVISGPYRVFDKLKDGKGVTEMTNTPEGE